MIRFGICNELFEGRRFADVCDEIKRVGYDGIEIAPFTLGPSIFDLSTTDRAALRRTIADAGLETIGTHWLLAQTTGYYLTSPDEPTRRRTADYLAALGELTRDLGGRLMVLGSPKQRDLLPGVGQADATAYAEDVLSRVVDRLGGLGVTLCLEPLAPAETDFLNTCDQAEALIGRIGHPNLALQMDVKAQAGEPGRSIPDLIRRHAGRAAHFHAQDPNRRGPGMGPTDFGPILAALVESGYDRWVSVEAFDFSPGATETATISLTTLRDGLDRAAITRRRD